MKVEDQARELEEQALKELIATLKDPGSRVEKLLKWHREDLKELTTFLQTVCLGKRFTQDSCKIIVKRLMARLHSRFNLLNFLDRFPQEE